LIFDSRCRHFRFHAASFLMIFAAITPLIFLHSIRRCRYFSIVRLPRSPLLPFDTLTRELLHCWLIMRESQYTLMLSGAAARGCWRARGAALQTRAVTCCAPRVVDLYRARC